MPSLVLWLFDIVDRMQSTFGLEVHARVMAMSCCVAVGLGSDSARVNEVAKLCRAVVCGDGRRVRSEGAPAGIGVALMSGF
jgi:hypothetical protein